MLHPEKDGLPHLVEIIAGLVDSGCLGFVKQCFIEAASMGDGRACYYLMLIDDKKNCADWTERFMATDYGFLQQQAQILNDDPDYDLLMLESERALLEYVEMSAVDADIEAEEKYQLARRFLDENKMQ